MSSFEDFLCLLTAAVPTSAVIGVVASRLLPDRSAARIRLLERKVDHLHERLKQVEARPADVIPRATEATAPPPLPEAPPVEEPLPPLESDPDLDDPGLPPLPDDPGPLDLDDDEPFPARPPFQMPSIERLAVWVGASLGALLLAFGGLFAVVAAVEAGWFGPGLRVASGMVLGTVAWVGGAVARSRAPWAGSALSAAGASTVFGAVWAAASLYHLVPAPAGFALLVLVVATTMAQAARFHDRYLGVLAVLGGLLASTVVQGDGAGPRIAYALLLNVAVVGLAARRSWPELLGLVGLGTAVQLMAFSLDAQPEQQLPALFGITALTVPFAWTWARHAHPLVRGFALGVVCLYLLVASPWTPPLDESFWDPRTGLPSMTRSSDPGVAALGMVALVVPAWLAARRSDTFLPTAAVVMAAGLPLIAFALGWDGAATVRSLVPVALVALATLLLAGRRSQGAGLAPLFAVAPLLLPLSDGAVGPTAAALVALTALTVTAPWTSTPGLTAAGALLPTGLAALLLAGQHDGEPAVGLAIALVTLLHLAPAASRWADDPLPELPWLGALLAPTVFLLPAYLAWSDAWGTSAIGLLPLITAAITLAVATWMVRTHTLPYQSALFAVGVIGVLGGLTLAVPLQLQERWLTVGWALEGAALALLSRRLVHPLIRGTSVLLGVAVAVRLLVNPYALAWGDAAGWPVLNWTLYTWGVPTACLLISAHALQKSTPAGSALAPAPVLLQLLAMLTGFALVNVQVSHAFQDHGPLELAGSTMLQGMVRSLSWGAYGSLLLGVGLRARSRTTRLMGFGFILLGALKACLWDMWSLPGLIRVGSLVGLGLFLVASAFVFERLVLRPSKAAEGE